MSVKHEFIGTSLLFVHKLSSLILSDFCTMNREQLRATILNVTDQNFESVAMSVYQYQYANNSVYRKYCRLLLNHEEPVNDFRKIPFLPVELFKSEKIISGNAETALIFTSSGTTGEVPSKHYVHDPELYRESILKCFGMFCGEITSLCILALLPSYLERKGSSLVYMAEVLMKESANPLNGFFLADQRSLAKRLNLAEQQQQKTLLLGVSFGLLDFAEHYSMPLRNSIVMETGGMKGRRPEITREELHENFKRAFGLEKIWSEYGMTELLSQAYSHGDGKFRTPPWMKVLLRDAYDPLNVTANFSTGAINIIDLANLDSCSFISSSDLGKLNADGTFEVMGRMDMSDVRGCNLMWEQ